MSSEPVLLVPPKLTKSAYASLVRNGFVARRWHLEGRHGSRTHRVADGRMGLPILRHPAKAILSFLDGIDHDDMITIGKDIKDLLSIEGVEIVYKKVPLPTSAPVSESTDAAVHPERARHLNLTKLLPTQSQESRPVLPAFTFAELFCGIGGFAVALEALGGECVFASDVSEPCRRVYAANVRVPPTGIHGDIYKVPDSAFPDSFDLLVAGFPCQPFSSLGNQPGLFDGPRGLLYTQIVRMLKACKPKAFLLENVPGLLNTGSSLSTIVSSLKDAGYKVTYEVCSSRCLTAQSRKRLYFVGLRKPQETLQNTDGVDFEFPFIPDLGLRCEDILHYDECDDEQFSELYQLTDDQMHQLLHRSKRWKPAKLAWPNTVCNTLDGHYGVTVGKGNSQLVPGHASLHPRRFTLRECSRIMGFPQSFQIPSKPIQGQGERAFLKEHYLMFGNAVCPPVIAAIAGAILAHCPSIAGYHNHTDWVEWGRDRAVCLSLESVIPRKKSLIKKRVQEMDLLK